METVILVLRQIPWMPIFLAVVLWIIGKGQRKPDGQRTRRGKILVLIAVIIGICAILETLNTLGWYLTWGIIELIYKRK